MYILLLDILVIKIKFFFFHSDTEYKKKKKTYIVKDQQYARGPMLIFSSAHRLMVATSDSHLEISVSSAPIVFILYVSSCFLLPFIIS